MPPKVGQRIILRTLLWDDDFPGEIVKIHDTGLPIMKDLCTVKLDCQDEPVHSVLYFEKAPEIVNSSLWQFCFPMQRLE